MQGKIISQTWETYKDSDKSKTSDSSFSLYQTYAPTVV